jgi:hypothetical protein
MDKVKKYAGIVGAVLSFVVLVGSALVPGFKEAVCGLPAPQPSPSASSGASGQ